MFLAVEDLMIQGTALQAIPLMLWWCKCINVITHPGFGSQSGGPKTKTL